MIKKLLIIIGFIYLIPWLIALPDFIKAVIDDGSDKEYK
jgi:hypothetical protein